MFTDNEIDEIYRKFATEFVNSGNEKSAALAAGVEPAAVIDFLKRAYDHPEVIRILAEDETSVPDFNNADEVKRHVLKSLWREARFRGPGAQPAARISALKALAELTGIEPAKKIDLDASRGGMMLVPVMDAALWEESCEKMQRNLKAAARE